MTVRCFNYKKGDDSSGNSVEGLFVRLGILVAWLFLCLSLPFWVKHDLAHAEMALLGFWVLFILMFLIGIPLTSTIIVDDIGIGWMLLNRVWRKYQWQDIKRVRILDFYLQDNSFPPRLWPVALYCLDVKDKPITHPFPIGTLTFKETLVDLRELLDVVNAQIKRHQIQIVDLRASPLKNLDQL